MSAHRPDNDEIEEKTRGLRRRKGVRAASKKWFERHRRTPSRVGEDRLYRSLSTDLAGRSSRA
jgi:hypothetical protein